MDTIPDIAPASKRCPQCKRVLPLTDFYIRKSTGRPRGPCKACENAITGRYYKERPEYGRSQSRKWAEANPEKWDAIRRKASKKHLPKHKLYRKAHAQEISEWTAKHRRENLEKYRQYNREYAKNNRDRLKIIKHRRRARRWRSVGNYTLADWLAVKQKYGGYCLRCGMPEPLVKLSADHVVPLARGGTNWPSNLQPLCILCNCWKNTKTVEFRPDHLLPYVPRI